MKTKTKTAPTLDLRASCVAAVQTLRAAGAEAWRSLYRAAHAGLNPTPETLVGIWKDAGETLADSSATTYASQLGRGFKLGAAGHALPDLLGCASMRAVHEAVKAAYDAAGLKDNRGKASPVAALKAEATAKGKAFKAAEKAAKAAETAAATLPEGHPMRALAEAAIQHAQEAAVAAAKADAALADAQAAKGPAPVTLKTATPVQRMELRDLHTDTLPALAALAKAYGANPIGSKWAGRFADLEAEMRAEVGTIDEIATALAAGK